MSRFFDPEAPMSEQRLDAYTRPFEDEEALLQQRMAMAEALRTSNAQQRTTALGAGLAGLGDILGAGVAGYQQHKGLGQMEALAKDKQGAAKDWHRQLQEMQREARLRAFDQVGTRGAAPAGLTFFPEGY